MNFEDRCRVAEGCLPDAEYRKRLTILHNEMLDRIKTLENAPKAVVGVGCKIDSNGEKIGTFVGSGYWYQYVKDAGLLDQWLELAFIPVKTGG